MIRRVLAVVSLCALGLGCAGMGSGAPVTLIGLESGDVACYVTVNDGSEEKYYDGDFELCEGGGSDATPLIGKSVMITTEKAQVQAGSCEGDPECTETEEVDLVVSIAAAEG